MNDYMVMTNISMADPHTHTFIQYNTIDSTAIYIKIYRIANITATYKNILPSTAKFWVHITNWLGWKIIITSVDLKKF